MQEAKSTSGLFHLEEVEEHDARLASRVHRLQSIRDQQQQTPRLLSTSQKFRNFNDL